MRARDLQPLLAPRSIAVVGASSDTAKLPGRPLAYLDRYGFAGAVHAVNPKYEAIGRFPCVASVDALPAGVDLALILLPAPAVAEALEATEPANGAPAAALAAGIALAAAAVRQTKDS